MKKTIVVAMVFAAFMAGSGCIKDKEKDFAEDQVSFSANTGALETRTDYGEDGSVGGTSVTYVNWVAGDKIRILSSTTSTDTYTVSEDHDGSDSQGISKANVNPDGAGITWGTGTQTFYGMYPANVTGSDLTSSAMTCVIPASWTPTDATISQLPYGYMFARLETARTTNVSLTFNSKFTAFTFTLKNPTASAVTLTSFTLSDANKDMCGTYTVNSATGTIGTLPTTGTNKTITVNFTSLTGGGLTIPAGTTANPGTRTFTIVAVPDSFSNLTLSCTSSGTTKTMGLKKNGTYLTFAAGLKHNIAITLPDFTNFTYTLSVTSPTDLDYAAGTSSTGRITSKRSDGAAVSWSVENYYASAADAESKTHPLGSQSWVTSGLGTNMTGGENLALNIVHTAITPDETTISTDIASIINGEISGKSSVGTVSEPINLANSSGGTGTYITESANCYIVNGPGWYKIPLVMGNGVKGNRTNSQSLSYTGRAYSGTGKNYTQQFVDYKNQIVTSPYLQNSNSVSGKKPGTPSSASVVWQDVSGLVNSCSIMASTSTTSDNNTVFWLEFEVPSGTVQQGNAVIAVYDTDSESPTVDQIMWSYHIWVSNHTSEMDISNYMPYLLGWKATGGSITKKSFKVYARLEQVSPGTEHAILELECPESTVQNHSTTGSALYYQWGRKDPLHSTDTQKATTSAGFTTNYVYSFRYPTNFLRHGQTGHVKTFWVGSSERYRNAYNLWNATNETTGIGKTVVKTIYDPSPAGYTVPASNSLGTLDVGVVNASYRYMRSSTSTPYDAIWQTDKILLWSAAPSADNHAHYYEGTASSTGYSFSPGDSEHYCHLGNALPVLPVVDTSYDPTDNGVLGSGTGPNINWQN